MRSKLVGPRDLGDWSRAQSPSSLSNHINPLFNTRTISNLYLFFGSKVLRCSTVHGCRVKLDSSRVALFAASLFCSTWRHLDSANRTVERPDESSPLVKHGLSPAVGTWTVMVDMVTDYWGPVVERTYPKSLWSNFQVSRTPILRNSQMPDATFIQMPRDALTHQEELHETNTCSLKRCGHGP